MKLELREFRREFYPEYSSWFSDPELNRRLGPMDDAWLEAVTTMPRSAGVTWAVFRDTSLVAVVETMFDPEGHRPTAITAVAVKPALRRQGIGMAALEKVLLIDRSQGMKDHIAFVSHRNEAAQSLLKKAGFVKSSDIPDEHDLFEFRHSNQQPTA